MNRFSEMDTSQLKETIEKEIGKTAPDRGTVMECLQELKRRDPEGNPDEVLAAWEASQLPKAKTIRKGWGQIIAAAAILTVVLLATVPDVCGEENVIQLIGRWTDSIFSFGEIQEHEFIYQTDHPGLQELYDTVTDLGAERNVVPTWLPSGYKLKQLETRKQPDGITAFAIFVDQKHQILINVKVFTSTTNTEYQKGSEIVELFEQNGIKHYIMKNDDTWTAAWIVDNIECSVISWDKEILHKIISSIYRSEK